MQHTFIIAGMFGYIRRNTASRNKEKLKWREIYDFMLQSTYKNDLTPRQKKDFDQVLLKRLVWPYARNNSVIHDSYTCKIKYLRGTDVRPFPTRRLHGRYNFVGSNGGNITIKKDGPCPKECRPILHQDWLLC